MKTKRFFRNVSPLNNDKEMPKLLYIVKKLLAFFLVYGVSAVIGEGIIIGILYATGFDPLSGVMPQGNVAQLMQYFGFSVFFIIAVLYCRVVEKREFKSLGLTKRGFDYFMGATVAVVLLVVVVIVCCLAGAFEFTGIGSNINVGYIIALFFGFMVQSFAEEFMCRAFLMKSLLQKTSLPIAVFVSSTAFALPHFSTLFEADFAYAVTGVINLYLVSVVFSLLYVLRDNIFVVGGLHGVWNFVLYGVLGLSVSGSEANANGLVNFNVTSQSLINGGVYGVEASVVTTIVLGITVVVLTKRLLDRRDRNGF